MVNGSCDGTRDVLGTRRLVRPFDVRLGGQGGIPVRQVGLDRDLRAGLLPRGDHERRLVRLCVEDPTHGIAHPRGRVQVDVGRPPRGLREAVGHPHHNELLQAQHIREVLRKAGEHGQLGRPRVAEDRRHPVSAEQRKSCFTNVGHAGFLSEGRTPRASSRLLSD